MALVGVGVMVVIVAGGAGGVEDGGCGEAQFRGTVGLGGGERDSETVQDEEKVEEEKVEYLVSVGSEMVNEARGI